MRAFVLIDLISCLAIRDCDWLVFDRSIDQRTIFAKIAIAVQGCQLIDEYSSFARVPLNFNGELLSSATNLLVDDFSDIMLKQLRDKLATESLYSSTDVYLVLFTEKIDT